MQLDGVRVKCDINIRNLTLKYTYAFVICNHKLAGYFIIKFFSKSTATVHLSHFIWTDKTVNEIVNNEKFTHTHFHIHARQSTQLMTKKTKEFCLRFLLSNHNSAHFTTTKNAKEWK